MTFTTELQPGVCPTPPVASDGFVLNHTMLRVKDPAVALDFYTRVFGMRLLRKLDFPEMKFSLFFLNRAQAGDAPPPDEVGERTAWTFAQRGLLELTHNWGTETDPEPETGDAGAAAFLHGPEGLFPTAIPTQTLGALREDQGHDDAEETVR